MPSAFHDALFHLHCLHADNPRVARTRFPGVLALATPAERAFLDELADTFTRYRFETAHKRLDAMWKAADPERRELINLCAPDTDPACTTASCRGSSRSPTPPPNSRRCRYATGPAR
ncbi:hypothetical protein OH799_01330 [Nocardia sp. NBC_00881]|uniref:hypothetical protein n=1 Tax=Nocardia sp. NBC_00881 TaxID=2975995 RepID=UPI00386D2E90|nr:hypothetical protein OH799_01330 [Nocardia sp. NBC_00881]